MKQLIIVSFIIFLFVFLVPYFIEFKSNAVQCNFDEELIKINYGLINNSDFIFYLTNLSDKKVESIQLFINDINSIGVPINSVPAKTRANYSGFLESPIPDSNYLRVYNIRLSFYYLGENEIKDYNFTCNNF